MGKTNTQRNKEWRDKQIKAGAKQLVILIPAETAEALARIARGCGSQRQAIIKAVKWFDKTAQEQPSLFDDPDPYKEQMRAMEADYKHRFEALEAKLSEIEALKAELSGIKADLASKPKATPVSNQPIHSTPKPAGKPKAPGDIAAELAAIVERLAGMPRSRSEKSAIMEIALAMESKGMTPNEITEAFNSAGLPNLSGRGKGTWDRGTVGNLLKEAKGAGNA